MSEGYTENDTNAGYQESYMGGAVQKQIGEQKKSEKKKWVYLKHENENENDRS